MSEEQQDKPCVHEAGICNVKPTLTTADEAGPIDPVQFAKAAEAFSSVNATVEIPPGQGKVQMPASPAAKKAQLVDGGIIFSEGFDKALAAFVRALENDLRDVGKETMYHTVVGPALGVVFRNVLHRYRPKPSDVPFTVAEFIDLASKELDMHPLALADYTVTFMHHAWEQQAAAKGGIVGIDGKPIT